MARSGCIYGPTGTFKTAQIKSFAHYIAETTGKATLLLSCDGGGWEPCNPEVKAGMIVPYQPEMATLPLSILRKVSQGYWPQDAEERIPERINLLPIDWTSYGGMAVEGWTSISQLIMRYLPDKGINVGGEDRFKLGGFAQQIRVNDEIVREDFRSNTRGDYGFVQNHLYGLVMNFNAMPVRYTFYTALESKGEDDSKRTVLGPDIAGKKATGQCGSWVGDLIHAQDYGKPVAEKIPDPADPKKLIDHTRLDVSVRFFFEKHIDPDTGMPFPAKPRVTPEQKGELRKMFPGSYFEPTLEGTKMTGTWFGDYLRAIDRLAGAQAQSDTLTNWRQKQDAKLGRSATPTTKS